MERFFIGDVARKFGLNPRTIRYYETIGLLPKTRRTQGGYRIYTDETIKRLVFIIKAKTLGLKLAEIKEILQLYEKGEVPCECTKDIIRNKIKELEEKIIILSELKTKLTEILRTEKHKKGIESICPIIEGSGENT